MCVGAIHWAGVPEVVAAARKEDAERAGFVEGPGGFDARPFLETRGISYREDLLREEALAIFRAYKGEVYNG
jgi:tRNA(Arg) A34 adenosine deaminase TadA